MNLLDAYQLACHLHTGQLDKAGRPYIEHLTRVLLRVQEAGGDTIQQIASLLHDSIEDGKVSVERLLSLGVPKEAVELVVVLTKAENQSYEEYLAGVKNCERVRLVKIGDLDDNSDPTRLAALPDAVAQRLRQKYESARQLLAAASKASKVPAQPLTKAEAKWLADVEKLLLACPSNRLGAYTTGDAELVIYDKQVADAWLAKHFRRRDELDADEQHKRAGSHSGRISTGFQIDSFTG